MEFSSHSDGSMFRKGEKMFRQRKKLRTETFFPVYETWFPFFSKEKSYLCRQINSKMKRTVLLILLTALLPLTAPAQPTAMDIAADMYPGWNLGNTMEPGPCNWLSNPLDYETAWQGSKTTQEIIDFVKAQGFRSVRIPCS